MFIYNLNVKQIVKFLLILIIIGVIVYFLISAYKIYNNSFKVKDKLDENNTMYLTTQNYTNVLKSVYENIDNYVEKRICFSGYVYKTVDFKETEFVLARDMLVSDNSKTLIVGFLCNYKHAKNFDENSWVEITGKIEKGNYHGEIPVIAVEKIKQIEKPADDIYVYPPDDTYIPTSAIF